MRRPRAGAEFRRRRRNGQTRRARRVRARPPARADEVRSRARLFSVIQWSEILQLCPPRPCGRQVLWDDITEIGGKETGFHRAGGLAATILQIFTPTYYTQSKPIRDQFQTVFVKIQVSSVLPAHPMQKRAWRFRSFRQRPHWSAAKDCEPSSQRQRAKERLHH